MIYVSVILAIYNGENEITETMHSLLTQTIGESEIILVDAGSTDHTYQICSSYLSMYSNVKVLHISQQGNLSMARNMGLSMAQGRFVFFAQANVVYEPYALERLCYPLRERQVDIAYGYYGGKQEYEQQMRDYPSGYRMDETITRQWFLEHFPKDFLLVPGNKMYKREILTEREIKFVNSPAASEAFFQLRYMQRVRNMVIVPQKITSDKLQIEKRIPDVFDWDMEKKATIEYYRLAQEWKLDIQAGKLMVLYFQNGLARHLQAMTLVSKQVEKKKRIQYYKELAADPWVEVMLSGEEKLGGFMGTVLGAFASGQYTTMEGMLMAHNQILGYKDNVKHLLKRKQESESEKKGK